MDNKLMKWARCQMKWYCSKACQVAHWKQGASPQMLLAHCNNGQLNSQSAFMPANH